MLAARLRLHLRVAFQKRKNCFVKQRSTLAYWYFSGCSNIHLFQISRWCEWIFENERRISAAIRHGEVVVLIWVSASFIRHLWPVTRVTSVEFNTTCPFISPYFLARGTSSIIHHAQIKYRLSCLAQRVVELPGWVSTQLLCTGRCSNGESCFPFTTSSSLFILLANLFSLRPNSRLSAPLIVENTSLLVLSFTYQNRMISRPLIRQVFENFV